MEITEHPAYRLEYVPEPPDTLSEGAKQEWLTLVPVIYQMATARPADLHTIGLLCEIQADIRNLEAAIRAEGFTIEAGSGGRKAHPAMQTPTAARRQAQTLLDRFGLVPGSDARRAQKFSVGNYQTYYGN